MSQFKYIADISEQFLDDAIVIPCKNEQGFPSIIIKNDSQKLISSYFATDNLSIKLDKVLSKENKDYYVHIIESKKQDCFAAQQFEIIYEYIFGKITEPISSVKLFGLISSLEEYFRLTPDPNRKQIQIGVFGELLFIKYTYEIGYSGIVGKYHSNFFTKHDIEINDKLRIEVKTAVGEKRIHHFKHDQLYRKDVQVLVASLLLEGSQEGLSLYDLFNEIIAITVDPDKIFSLKKLMVRCGVSEDDRGLSFSRELAYSRIRVFNADSLPKIAGEAPKGISGIEYDVDCSLAIEENMSDVVSLLHSSDKID